MAQIVHSSLAPDEEVTYSFQNTIFSLKGAGSFQTDEADVITNAHAHPWLEVRPDAPAEDPAPVADAPIAEASPVATPFNVVSAKDKD